VVRETHQIEQLAAALGLPTPSLVATVSRGGGSKGAEMDYRQYMQSPEWRDLRQRVIDRAGGKCEFCDAKAVTAHHVKYPKGGYAKDDIGNLVACCWPCQEKSHGIRKEDSGEPRGEEAVDAILTKHGVTNTRCRNALCLYAADLICKLDTAEGVLETHPLPSNYRAIAAFACDMYKKVAPSKLTLDDGHMFMVCETEATTED